MYEIFEKLLNERGVTAYKVAKETGVTTATLTSWKQGKYVPKQEKLQKIADYFGVSLDYLLTGEEKKEPALNARDKKDIEKNLAKIMAEYREGTRNEARYNDMKLEEEDLDLIEAAMRIALEQIKIKNKELYTPKKYKKDKK